MAIKSYIRGFTAYPVDTREMTSAANTLLKEASAYAFANDSITLALSNCNIEWEYFGSQVFMIVTYQV